MFERVTREVRITLPEDFEPKVSFGSNVRVGTLLGVGTREVTLEEYPLPPKTKLHVEDGQYVLPDTPLFTTKGLFDEIIGVSEHEGLVRIKGNTLCVVDVVDRFEYKSPAVGKVTLLTPEELVISGEFYEIRVFSMSPYSVEGYLYYHPLQEGKNPKTLLQNVTGRIVIFDVPPTISLIERTYRAGARAVVLPSVDWAVYHKLLPVLQQAPLVVLQGFGEIKIWSFLHALFKTCNHHYVQIDHQQKAIYITPRTVEIDRNVAIIIKDTVWGKEVPVLRKEVQIPDANEFEIFHP